MGVFDRLTKLVHLHQKSLHELDVELRRWWNILAVEYNNQL